jgi:hypothetical protein
MGLFPGATEGGRAGNTGVGKERYLNQPHDAHYYPNTGGKFYQNIHIITTTRPSPI